MYRILLAEDEPPARRYLKNIIETKCQGFEVIEETENGERALEIIEILKPDLVITDIKMPIMDGIELVTQIKKNYPNIFAIITSGYSDFEYTKSAIQSGVVDYLLKPVKPLQLQELLNTMKDKLDKLYYEKQIQLFKALIRGDETEAEHLKRYLPCSTYNIALLRKNGPPSRYRSDAINMSAAIEYRNKKDLWTFMGQDEHEILCIASGAIEDSVREIGSRWIEEGYCTASIYSKRVEKSDLKRGFKELIQAIQASTIIGENQIFKVPRIAQNGMNHKAVLEDVWVKKIEFMVSNLMLEDLKKEMIKVFQKWEQEKLSLLEVENYIRQILHIVKKYSSKPKEIGCSCIEISLDEAICSSISMGELMENVWDITQSLLKTNKNTQYKLAKEEFLDSIENYLMQNLAQPLSLQSVSTHLGMSQTYLSRLFRKHKNTSFNEYVTLLRINQAKKLMNENPQILLKDIAEMVGYSDPAYFSRVFRTITGIPPSYYDNNAE
ncbi:MAG: two component transcriptional regulator, AraC family [Clostridia bacterium]|jgi:YesN/AraC family two-component response regulator|nr:two component transcriptional regulator, AraC family [Clostridia bacterium]